MSAAWARSRWSRRAVLGAGGVAGAGGLLAGLPFAPGPALAGEPDASDLPHDPSTAPVKTASTFYTPAKVDAARRNVADYAWGAQLRDDAIVAAQPYVDADPDWLWSQISSQGLPRSYAVNQDLGSPITGRDIYQYGNYPWIHDHFERPWKMVDPSSDYVFPTNDFEAFYRSGLNARGEFDRSLADESLLVNELYPERGPSWGVDDGFGWIDEDGNKWTFIAYYNHWAMWYASWLDTGITNLSNAYLYTGDALYARAGLILLDRVADLYPAMDTEPYKRSDGYFHSDGLSGNGRVVGCIWETGLIRDHIYAYDALFPAIAETDTVGVVEFLSAKAQEYGLPAKDTVEDIRLNIENGVLRQACAGVLSAKIYGNFGMHQHTLAAAAVVLDDPDQSPSWIDFVFATGGRVAEPEYHVTGGAFYETLIDGVDRDGAGNEGAPGYNDLWIGHVRGVADVLADYEGYPQADLYEHPKYAKMFQTRPRLSMVGKYFPSIGDSGQTGKPGLRGTTNDYVSAFERFGDPEYAQLAYLIGDGDLESLYGGVFSLDVEGIQQRIADIIKKHGPFLPDSDNLTGYGLAVLRDGDVDHQRTTWMYYGRNTGHGHRDGLNLGLYAFGLDLLADLGYPEFADRNARRHEWTSNTIAHNTVVVDESPHQNQWVGTPHGFVATKHVQFADISAPQVYPQPSTFRRAVAQIRIDAENSYAVDFFRVKGGSDHHYSFHAAEGPVSTTALNLVKQPTGAHAVISYPWQTSSSAGQYGALSQQIDVQQAESHQLSVRTKDDFPGGTSGYHFIQILIDDAVVAERDVAGDDGVVTMTADVTEQLSGKTGAKLTLRVLEKKGVGNFGVSVQFDEVSVTGATVRNGDFTDSDTSMWTAGSNTSNFEVTPRTVTGSYAGPDVAPPPADAVPRAGASGFDWLSNVQRDDEPPAAFTADWSIVDTYDTQEPDGQVHIRLHAFHDAADVAFADGKPPRNKPGNPESLRYLISHRHGSDLASQFVSVIEPYVDNPMLESVERVEVAAVDGSELGSDAAALKVVLANGRVDYVISSARPEVEIRVDDRFRFAGSFGVCSFRDGRAEYGILHDGTGLDAVPQLRERTPALTGTLSDFTRELSSSNELTVRLDVNDNGDGNAADPNGSYVYVENDGVRNASYRIAGVRVSGQDSILDIGDATPIRGYVDPEDFDRGFRYDVERGAAVRIPLTHEWSVP